MFSLCSIEDDRSPRQLRRPSIKQMEKVAAALNRKAPVAPPLAPNDDLPAEVNDADRIAERLAEMKRVRWKLRAQYHEMRKSDDDEAAVRLGQRRFLRRTLSSENGDV